MKDLPRSARIHRAVPRDPKIKLVSLVAPIGERTQSKGQTFDLLLATHFPNSVCVESGGRHPLPPAVPNFWTGRWLRGLLLIEGWAERLILLPHIKVQVWKGSFQLYYKRDARSLFLT